MTDPYRTGATIVVAQEEERYGRLIRKSGCGCRAPSWWRTLWMRVETDDEFECPHGARWRWYVNHWTAARAADT